MKNNLTQLESKVGTVLEFVEDGIHYEIKGEQNKQFHFEAELYFYGMKNGWYVKGTTSKTPNETLQLMKDELNLKYER